MEQHQVPQQISSYQFRLVGDMTIKQFFQVAAGALVGLIIYALPLPPVIKWPIIIFSALSGIALAFFPVAERPLSAWIFAFFRSVYAPTVYHWQKPAKPAVYFKDEPISQPPQAAPVQEENLATQSSQSQGLEEKEKSFLSRIAHLFTFPNQPIRVPKEVPPSTPLPSQEELAIPQKKFVTLEKTPPRPKVVVEEPITPSPAPIQTTPVSETLISRNQDVVQSATFSPEASPPNPPTQANIITGQVLDPVGKIIEKAIIEIKDSQGRPVRALKTNALGHFLIVTPLANGRYEIITEKEGFTFDNLYFEAEGSIIPPIRIISKETVSTT